MDYIKSLLREELQQIGKKTEALLIPDNEIKNELYHFINGSSKRIRSVLTLLYLKCNNAVITEKIINVITSAELIHNASLLHDDVIDNASVRRGRATLAKSFSSKASILAGDYLVSIAVSELFSINNSAVNEIILNCTKQMSEAEIKQLTLRGKNISLDDYLDIIKGKTASLFYALVKSCAILANIDIKQASDFGELFGILYQINNDEETSSRKSDLLNQTKTAVDILGIENTDSLKDNYKDKIRAIICRLPENLYRKSLEDLIELL